MDFMLRIKKEIERLLRQSFLLKYDPIIENIESPPNPEMGDMASNIAFSIASKLRKSPVKISKEILKEIKLPKDSLIRDIQAKDGYINIYIE
jgi:arginyl-tRNA synthetase